MSFNANANSIADPVSNSNTNASALADTHANGDTCSNCDGHGLSFPRTD
jgi:hypothetical protein